MNLHRTILNLHHNHCDHHQDGKDCIEVIWNCTDKLPPILMSVDKKTQEKYSQEELIQNLFQ